jgi:microcystin-dependent protein
MSDPFLGEVRMFATNFAPIGWAACDGQLMPISQSTALFSLLGTQFGGNGVATFALPDLTGRVAIGSGAGPNLTQRQTGDRGGADAVTLTDATMPAHGHGLRAGASPTTRSPAGAALAPTANGAAAYRLPGATVAMSPAALALAGQSQPHENRPPSLALMFCIALQGIFPARN